MKIGKMLKTCVIVTLLHHDVKNVCFPKVEMSRHLRTQKKLRRNVEMFLEMLLSTIFS